MVLTTRPRAAWAREPTVNAASRNERNEEQEDAREAKPDPSNAPPRSPGEGEEQEAEAPPRRESAAVAISPGMSTPAVRTAPGRAAAWEAIRRRDSPVRRWRVATPRRPGQDRDGHAKRC